MTAETTELSGVAKLLKGSPWENMPVEKLPWYSAEIEEIPPAAQELFEKYSNVEANKVKAHIKQLRDKAYVIFPYPCLARWSFLDFTVSLSRNYPEVVERVKQGDKYLDLGCCVGQDIRKLVFDGAPSENTYGSDLEKNFIDIGYDLFLDRSTLKTTFIPADIFDEDSGLKQVEGEIDIVHAAAFLHLFDEGGVRNACKRIVKILKSKPGSLFIGGHIGNIESGDYVGSVDKNRKKFRHNPQSFKEMWIKVGEETGTRWDVDAHLKDEDLFARAEKMGLEATFIPPGSKWLSFAVRRIA
ncbi:hypothetical protein BU23DRAFT_583613 [Bimuria novae-zelandiae CBS 107.79]|uniref:Methyltransferase domain-containing protein n=1 Tax=Bimuria novae-zelandiae CBS 107.79 TaxID=1447943 RepID=A0A6A5UYC2_9PLEO|nr:hypothetical protein BU23DRAFT_583613 [Bimuria novae-zelandiae CBS 107.79]